MGLPSLRGESFVIENDRNVCFLCRETAKVAECPHCGEFYFAHGMKDFSDLIDSDYSEGQVFIHNDYGYSQFNACPECIDKIREDIEQQRADEYYHFMEEQKWHRSNQL